MPEEFEHLHLVHFIKQLLHERFEEEPRAPYVERCDESQFSGLKTNAEPFLRAAPLEYGMERRAAFNFSRLLRQSRSRTSSTNLSMSRSEGLNCVVLESAMSTGIFDGYS